MFKILIIWQPKLFDSNVALYRENVSSVFMKMSRYISETNAQFITQRISTAYMSQ